MSSRRAVVSDQVIGLLEELDSSDLEFVLAVVKARFPPSRGNGPKKTAKTGSNRKTTNMGGRGSGRGSAPGRGYNPVQSGPALVHNPPPPARTHEVPSGAFKAPDGSDTGLEIPTGYDPQNPKTDLNEEGDVLKDVLLKLKPVSDLLPIVSRDPSADKRGMSRKKVQTRLNKKRRDVQKNVAMLMDSTKDSFWAFESLNAIQGFLLTSVDALSTEGVRLRTDPLDEDFSMLVASLLEVAAERKSQNEISLQGYFTNNDQMYRAPEEHGTEDI
jgi:hypothetical protein